MSHSSPPRQVDRGSLRSSCRDTANSHFTLMLAGIKGCPAHHDPQDAASFGRLLGDGSQSGSQPNPSASPATGQYLISGAHLRPHGRHNLRAHIACIRSRFPASITSRR